MKNLILIASLAAGFGSPLAALAIQPQVQPAVLYSTDPVDPVEPAKAKTVEDDYSIGNRAMNEQRWQDAIAAFDKVIASKNAKADAAMYWKAYALRKINRSEESAATCGALRGEFPKSSWIKDCQALELQGRNVRVMIRKSGAGEDDDFVISPMPPAAPMPPSPASGYKSYSYSYSTRSDKSEPNDPDTDLKLLALGSLMHQDASRAIPILRDLLNGSSSDKVKRQALFVLGQNKAPECQALLKEIALGKQNPSLQREAISQLVISQGSKANDTVAEIYKQSTDEKVKKSALSALFISGQSTQLIGLARAEKDLSMKRNIVQQLAMMNDKAAQDYMLELLK